MSKTKSLEEQRNRYLKVSYAGKHLGYPLDTYGTWEVYGEDSNCDMGGPHYQPKLGIFEGTLGEVVDIAVMLPNFWQWGGGGDIRKVKIKTVKEYANEGIAALEAEKAAYLKRIAEIDAITGGSK